MLAISAASWPIGQGPNDSPRSELRSILILCLTDHFSRQYALSEVETRSQFGVFVHPDSVRRDSAVMSFRSFAVVLVLAAFSSPALAQPALTGVIRDSSGAVVPGATVIVRQPG